MTNLLSLILDTLIPPSADRRMPGAGALGLADAVRERARSSDSIVAAGLAAAEAKGFADLDAPAREEALRQIDGDHPGFIATLYAPTCIVYYEHPEVLVALGLDPGPPYPKGHTLESGHLAGLERVRARGRLYREA